MPGVLGAQRLMELLDDALAKETKAGLNRLLQIPSNQDEAISPAQRDEVVRWLAQLNGTFRFYPETLALAVSTLDRFLSIVKARPKYLRCMAVSCFFLAAKLSEEPEAVPMVKDLAHESECGCSPREILRMEMLVLDKLGWDLRVVTALDFLHIFQALVCCGRGHSLSAHELSRLTNLLCRCLTRGHLLATARRPATLALAVLSLELQRSGSPGWLAITAQIQRKAEIEVQDLVLCGEEVHRFLSTPPCPKQQQQQKWMSGENAVYVFAPQACKPRPSLSHVNKPVPSPRSPLLSDSSPLSSPEPVKVTVIGHPYPSKPIPVPNWRAEETDADYCDSIKSLYGEEGEWGSPCPPLQPPMSL
ncbi:cyclin-I-like [Lethenteron reissneri]|uniref:cyclin-I-like n=1 Tax=Lethenteron reissneri TaxID=7753 RepID=UPI002AB73C4D|nr:cyclin-I-like [Lethenteron reissneri]